MCEKPSVWVAIYDVSTSFSETKKRLKYKDKKPIHTVIFNLQKSTLFHRQTSEVSFFRGGIQ